MSVVVISLIPTIVILVIVAAVVVKVRRGLGSVPMPGGGGVFGVAGGGGDHDKMALAQRLQTSGRKCRATVMNVQSTGLIINQLNIQCDVTFQLQPLDGGPAFTGEKRMTINQTQMPRIGDVWPAWVDPADPSVFAVGQPHGASPEQIPVFREFGIPHPLDPSTGSANWSPPSGPPAGAPAAPSSAPPPSSPPAPGSSASRVADLERLARLRDQGVLTETEFQIEKNRILGT